MIEALLEADIVSPRTIGCASVRDIFVQRRQEHPVDNLAAAIGLLRPPQDNRFTAIVLDIETSMQRTGSLGGIAITEDHQARSTAER